MVRKAKPALTREAWLDELGRRLVWYFPAGQVKDILSDYQEQFEAGHDHCKTEAEIIQGLGTPAEAVALLLEEEPSAKSNCLRHSVLWGAVLAVCAAFFWVCFMSYTAGLRWIGALLFPSVTASVLFLLLRGPARVALEQPARISRTAAYYVPAALMLAAVLERLAVIRVGTDLFYRYDSGQMSEDAFEATGRVLRYGNVFFLLALVLVLGILAVWMLVRSVRRSVQYFPGAVHAFSTMISIFSIFTSYGSYYLSSLHRSLYVFPLFYFIGLATALTFQRWVDGRRPLPRFFRERDASFQDWRHRLGVSLLGWFPADQTLEILGDYQEQYELGREQGKSEEALLSEMGRPEAVVRDLLAEDRKARLNRRKSWPWIAAAAVAAWLLLGYVSAFEFGAVGVNRMLYYGPDAWKPGLIALLLGTVSLFVLLHARERAAVEQRFPTRRKPSVWLLVPPLVCSALAEGLGLGCIQTAPARWEPVFLGQSLVWCFITVIEYSVLLLLVLLIWTLARCVSGSIRHLPAVPFIAGSFTQVVCAGMYLSAMDLELIGADPDGVAQAFLFSLWPWAAGVLLAAASWLVLRTAGRKEG